MLKVLVVEDEELIRKGIALAVDWAALDCVVVGEAANGREALEAVKRYHPSLIITDLKMPEMDGLEMLAALREQGNPVYVIILTAYDSFAYAQQALRLGAVDFLLKPFHDGEQPEKQRLVFRGGNHLHHFGVRVRLEAVVFLQRDTEHKGELCGQHLHCQFFTLKIVTGF